MIPLDSGELIDMAYLWRTHIPSQSLSHAYTDIGGIE